MTDSESTESEKDPWLAVKQGIGLGLMIGASLGPLHPYAPQVISFIAIALFLHTYREFRRNQQNPATQSTDTTA